MPKRPNDKDKLRPDAAEIAFRVMREATGEAPKTPPPGERAKNPLAAKRGAAGGKVGGKARSEALTAKRRQSIARKAAKARWNSKKDK